MLKIAKKIKILFVLLMILLFINTIVFATDINMNLPAGDNDIVESDNNINTGINGTDNTENIQSDDSSYTNQTNTQFSDDIGGEAAPSSVSSIAQENMSFSNILNILLITVGVVLILLAIAILIRLK